MSHPKRHHFVPQFYLRRFSTNERSIVCYHKRSGRLITCAPIKGQCAVDNFYAWDDRVEKALSTIEGQAAKIFRNIEKNETLPSKYSTSYQELMLFIALQSSRTQLSGRESDDMGDYIAKLMAKGKPEFQDIDLENIRIGSKFPAALPMQIAANGYTILNELESCLLINNTSIPFMTSDNPVFFYNSQRSNIDWQGIIGMSSVGLQIFYPIDNKRMVYLYDPNVYNRPSNTGQRKIGLDDVIKINLGHYMWSGEVIFPYRAGSANIVEQMVNFSQPFLPYERSQNRESEIIEIDGEFRSLLHSFRAHVPIECNFSFARHDKNFPIGGSWMRPDGYEYRSDESEPDRRYEFTAPRQSRLHLKGNELGLAVSRIKRASR